MPGTQTAAPWGFAVRVVNCERLRSEVDADGFLVMTGGVLPGETDRVAHRTSRGATAEALYQGLIEDDFEIVALYCSQGAES